MNTEPVYTVTINPTNSDLVVTGAGDDQSILWNKATGEKIAVLIKHEDSISAVAYSATGDYVASGGMDGKVHVFDGATGVLVVSLDGPDECIVNISLINGDIFEFIICE